MTELAETDVVDGHGVFWAGAWLPTVETDCPDKQSCGRKRLMSSFHCSRIAT